jgi:hypothetical protein
MQSSLPVKVTILHNPTEDFLTAFIIYNFPLISEKSPIFSSIHYGL